MAANFPNIRPTTRSFTMGDYPSTTYRSLSGVTFRRNFGNKQTGYTIDLQFKNIGDSAELRPNSGTAYQIMQHYINVDGTLETFKLQDHVFDGMSESMESLIQAPSAIKWRYAEPPKVQSVKAGVSTVTVKLIGELEV